MKRTDFVVGTQYNWCGKLYHVRAIVDDDYMVVRRWSRKQRDWVYIVEEIEIMTIVLSKPNKEPPQ